MAKKRVHEIAKEMGIPSKEVLAILQKAGFDVKAAASSVDEADIARAFANGKDGGEGKAATADADAPAAKKQGAADGAKAKGAAAEAQQPAADAGEKKPSSGSDGQSAGKGASRPARGEVRPRPTRGGRAGERAPGGAGGRRRRVVIDSQASRRDRPAPPPQQPPRRGRGRRRRTPWVEPDLTPVEEGPKEIPVTKVKSGATVSEVAESLGLSAAEVIKK
ncbi:MAG TPA: translation initiation factor IF-2 N-terminal domain-containing protein, partial [Thermoleophilaceae bacterium]|nr:translation initiation factor IF-2 N-terminal domain-containing protein [Thermoleophilaceae bacterium]